MKRVDPVFQTRAELAEWAINVARQAGETHQAAIEAIDRIKRVTLAHVHLPVEKPS